MQVWDKKKKASKHKTCENNDTTDQVDCVSLLLSPRWTLLIRSPKKNDRHQSEYEEKAASKRSVRQPNCRLSLSGTHIWRSWKEDYTNRADTCKSANNIIQRRIAAMGDKENGNSTQTANQNISRHVIKVGTDGVRNSVASRQYPSEEKNDRYRYADNTNVFSRC